MSRFDSDEREYVQDRLKEIKKSLDDLKAEVEVSRSDEKKIERRRKEMKKMVKACKKSLGLRRRESLTREQKEDLHLLSTEFYSEEYEDLDRFKEEFQELSSQQQIEFAYNQVSMSWREKRRFFENMELYQETGVPVADILKLVAIEEYVEQGEVKLDIFGNQHAPWNTPNVIEILPGGLEKARTEISGYYEVALLVAPFTNPTEILYKIDNLSNEIDRPEVQKIIEIVHQKNPEGIMNEYSEKNPRAYIDKKKNAADVLLLPAQNPQTAKDFFSYFNTIIKNSFTENDSENNKRLESVLKTASENVSEEDEAITELINIVLSNKEWNSAEEKTKQIIESISNYDLSKIKIYTETKEVDVEAAPFPSLIIPHLGFRLALSLFPEVYPQIKEITGNELGKKITTQIIQQNLQNRERVDEVLTSSNVGTMTKDSEEVYKDNNVLKMFAETGDLDEILNYVETIDDSYWCKAVILENFSSEMKRKDFQKIDEDGNGEDTVAELLFSQLSFNEAQKHFPAYCEKLGIEKASVLMKPIFEKAWKNNTYNSRNSFTFLLAYCTEDAGYTDEIFSSLVKVMIDIDRPRVIQEYHYFKGENGNWPQDHEKRFCSSIQELIPSLCAKEYGDYFEQRKIQEDLEAPKLNIDEIHRSDLSENLLTYYENFTEELGKEEGEEAFRLLLQESGKVTSLFYNLNWEKFSQDKQEFFVKTWIKFDSEKPIYRLNKMPDSLQAFVVEIYSDKYIDRVGSKGICSILPKYYKKISETEGTGEAQRKVVELLQTMSDVEKVLDYHYWNYEMPKDLQKLVIKTVVPLAPEKIISNYDDVDYRMREKEVLPILLQGHRELCIKHFDKIDSYLHGVDDLVIDKFFGNDPQKTMKEILLTKSGVEKSKLEKIFSQAAKKEFSFFPETYGNRAYLNISNRKKQTIIHKPNEEKFLHACLVEMVGTGGKAGLILELLERQGFNVNMFDDGDQVWFENQEFHVQRAKDESIERVTLYCAREDLKGLGDWDKDSCLRSLGEKEIVKRAKRGAMEEVLENLPNVDGYFKRDFIKIFNKLSYSFALETLPDDNLPNGTPEIDISKNQLRCLAKVYPDFILKNIEVLLNNHFIKVNCIDLLTGLGPFSPELFWEKFEVIKKYALETPTKKKHGNNSPDYSLMSDMFLKLAKQKEGGKEIFKNMGIVKACVSNEEYLTEIFKGAAKTAPANALKQEILSEYKDFLQGKEIINRAIEYAENDEKFMSIFVSAPTYYTESYKEKLTSIAIRHSEKTMAILQSQEVKNVWEGAGLTNVREYFVKQVERELIKNEVYTFIENNPSKHPQDLKSDPTLEYYPEIRDTWITSNEHFKSRPKLKLRFDPSCRKELNSPKAIKRRKLLIARYLGLRNKDLNPSDITPEMVQEADYKIFEAKQKKYNKPLFQGRNVIGYFPSSDLGIKFENLKQAIGAQQTNKNGEVSGSYIDFQKGERLSDGARDQIINADPPLTFITHKHSASSTVRELQDALIKRWERLTAEGVEPSEENRDFLVVGGCGITDDLRDDLCRAMKKRGYPIPDIVVETEYGQYGYAYYKKEKNTEFGSSFLDRVVFNKNPQKISTFGTMWENRDKYYEMKDSKGKSVLPGNATFLSEDELGELLQIAMNEEDGVDEFVNV